MAGKQRNAEFPLFIDDDDRRVGKLVPHKRGDCPHCNAARPDKNKALNFAKPFPRPIGKASFLLGKVCVQFCSGADKPVPVKLLVQLTDQLLCEFCAVFA